MANTIDDLKEQALTIKNASQTGENTANRVGTLFYDIVDNLVVGKYEFRYKNSKVKPTKPADGSDGTTGGWSKEPSDPIYTEGELTWMTQCYYSYVNGYGKWSTPIRITGANGKDGEDGKDVEFIYTRNDTGKELRAPIYDARGNEIATQDDWYGTDSLGIYWTDNPKGVEEGVRYEYICVRTKEAGAARWNTFSEPVIWSKWGEKGKDGDGYEYIFINTSDESITPNINYDTWFDPRTQTYKTRNDDEYLPYDTDGIHRTRWNDDPAGVTATDQIEWVSVRKKINGVWGDFSEPKLWARWAEDGATGGHFEVRYKNYTPTDAKPLPDAPTGDGTSDGWVKQPLDPDVDHGEYTYMSQALYEKGIYGTWTPPIRITGGQGEAGADGSDIEFIYTRFTEEEDALRVKAPTMDKTKGVPVNTIDDWKGTDENDVTWTDNPEGITDVIKYECISSRIKRKGSLVWDAFSQPVIWSNWGEKGMDGDGYEYIYKKTNSDGAPEKPPLPADWNQPGTAYQKPDYIPEGWSDDPTGVDINNRFEWVCTRRRRDSFWEKFTNPSLWATYSEGTYTLDLDNQADVFGVDVNNDVIDQQVRETHAQIFIGTEAQTLTSFTATLYYSDGSAVPETVAILSHPYRDKIGTVTVTIKSGNRITQDMYAVIQAKCDKVNTPAYARFTITKIQGGEAGVSPTLYQLAPSANSFVFSKNGTVYKPTRNEIFIYLKKTTKDGTEIITTSQAGYTFKYWIDGVEKGTKQIGTSISVSSDNKEVVVRLYYNTKEIDIETLPVLKDGLDSTVPGPQGDQGTIIYKQYANWNSYSKAPTESQVVWETKAPAPDINYPYTWERTKTKNPKTGEESDWSYVCLTGKPGEPGKPGKMYYQAGEWSASKTYKMTDSACPLVYYREREGEDGKWYYLVASEASGEGKKPGTSYWEEAENYQVIIADAIFTNFAKFGSAVITGDWLISAVGYQKDAAAPDYTCFDPAHPNESVWLPEKQKYSFVPMLAMDLREGTTYQHKGFFEGTITSTAEGKGKWKISPSEYEDFPSPVITGYNKNGSEMLYMMFDGDPDDTVSFYKGGGLFFTNGTDEDKSYYLREGWRVKCPDYNRMDEGGKADAIMADPGTRLVRRPRIIVSSNYKKIGASGNYAVIEMYINTSVGGRGACIYSNDWKTKSYAAPDETYVDDWGYLKVKDTNNYERINVKTTDFTLPDNPPIGTIYLLKGKNPSNSMVVRTKDAPILQGSSNDILVPKNSSYNFGGVGVMLFYIGDCWAMIYSN